jgi:hypothetical protein
MSESAQALRLHILMEPPDIVWVFDRLRVLGLVPAWSFFRCRDERRAFLVIHLRDVDDRLVDFLVTRLRQIRTVRSVRPKRRISNAADDTRCAGRPDGND